MVAHAARRVVLSYGMGCESTAVLLRWLEDPSSRDFDLSDAIILTAMVGDEFADTGRLVTSHVLPRLRANRVRFVQVARAGRHEADGITVLGDSRAPRVLHLGGVYRLSSELAAAGTTPQVASGRRLCSLKFKGFVLDTWIASELGSEPFRHVMGFNLDEGARVQRDRSYSTTTRSSEYPLVTWGWDRARCEQYLQDLLGEPWPKSACVYCPFAANYAALPALLARYRRFPDAAVQAMLLELTSMALNPNMALFGSRSVNALVAADGNQAALTALERILAACDYTLSRYAACSRSAPATAAGRAVHGGRYASSRPARRRRSSASCDTEPMPQVLTLSPAAMSTGPSCVPAGSPCRPRSTSWSSAPAAFRPNSVRGSSVSGRRSATATCSSRRWRPRAASACEAGTPLLSPQRPGFGRVSAPDPTVCLGPPSVVPPRRPTLSLPADGLAGGAGAASGTLHPDADRPCSRPPGRIPRRCRAVSRALRVPAGPPAAALAPARGPRPQQEGDQPHRSRRRAHA